MPILPAYASSFGVSVGAAGWVITSYGLARLFVNLPVGVLSERFGRRPLLLTGGVVLALGSLLCGLADRFLTLVLFRFIAGAGAATVITASHIVLADLSTHENRGRMMSMYQGFFLLGVSLGPLPGGLLAERFGLGAPFLAFAALALAGAIVAAVWIPETRGAKSRRMAAAQLGSSAAARDGSPRGSPADPIMPEQAFSLRTLLTSRGFLLASVINFSQFFTRTGAIFNLVPLLGTLQLALDSAQVGTALTIVAVCTGAMLYPAGYLADRFGRKVPLVASCFLSGLGMALFAVADNYTLYLLGAMVWGIGSGVSGTLPSAYAADLVPASAYGVTMGAFRTLADAGYVFGPILLGTIAERWGFAGSLWLCTGLFVIGGAAFGLAAPETRVRKPPARGMRSDAR